MVSVFCSSMEFLPNLIANLTCQVLKSGHPNAHEIILSNMSVAFDRMLLEVEVN